MTTTSTQRPPQVTLAGSVVMVSSLLIVLTMWEQVSNLRSLETREAIETVVAGPMGQALGLGVEQTIRLLHVACLVSAACAAATGILGWFVMRRDKGARLALAMLAVPPFVLGLFTGGFAASFVAAAAAMLWLSPAREWFDTGRWTPPQPRTAGSPRQGGAAPWRPPSSPSSPSSPPTSSPPSSSPPSAGWPPPPSSAPFAGPGAETARATSYAGPPGSGPADGVPVQRPAAVVTAVVLTTSLSVLVALGAVAGMIAFGLSPDGMMDMLEQQQPTLAAEDISLAQLRTSIYVTGAVCVVLCALALTFAGFLMARRDWARRGLMVTAAFSAGVSLLVALSGGPVAVLLTIAAMATVALLNRPDTRAWCGASGPTRRR